MELEIINLSDLYEFQINSGDIQYIIISKSTKSTSYRTMPLNLIGLGLGSPDDITIRGKKLIETSDYIYLECYTSVFPGTSRDDLETLYGKEVIEADRNLVESGCREMLKRAVDSNVSFLVVGDPLCATTHTDLFLRAKEMGVRVVVVHNASIMNAISSTGLQLYRFGETISVPFWTQKWKPESFYDKLIINFQNKIHTLCLLDIKVKEVSEENMRKGRWDIFEGPRFMTVGQCLEQLLAIEEKRFSENHPIIDNPNESHPIIDNPNQNHPIVEDRITESIVKSSKRLIGVARLGAEDQIIKVGTAQELLTYDFGAPLHAFVVPAEELHECELEMLEYYS